MTPTELHQLVEPLWKKHPETRPERLTFCDEVPDDPWFELEIIDDYTWIAADDAAQLIESSLVRWLSVNCSDGIRIEPYIVSATMQEMCNVIGYSDYGADITEFSGGGKSLLEALISAAMSIPSAEGTET